MVPTSTASSETAQATTKWVAPFNLAFNTPLGYFEWLELPENAARFNRFGHAMTGTRQWETKDGILKGKRPLFGFALSYIWI